MPAVGKFLNKKTIISIVVIIILIFAGWLIHNRKNKTAEAPKSTANETPAQSEIRFYKNAKTPDAMRTLAAAYEENGQYNQSKTEWQAIANRTKQIADWWSLLTICTTYKVSGQANCINSSASALKGQINQIGFQTAYAIGYQLETSGYGKLAVPFYQRALNTYNPPTGTGVTYPSKVQIQDKINELNK